MNRLLLCLAIVIGACSVSSRAQSDAATAANQVRETERAFAKTMADRNHAAFVTFVADDAVFMPEGGAALRGRQAVAAAWKRFYDGPQAPFSWEPERVEVLDAANLAFSSGPVRNAEGKRIGTFNSIWRREPGGDWKIVFDKGCPACTCE